VVLARSESAPQKILICRKSLKIREQMFHQLQMKPNEIRLKFLLVFISFYVLLLVFKELLHGVFGAQRLFGQVW